MAKLNDVLDGLQPAPRPQKTKTTRPTPAAPTPATSLTKRVQIMVDPDTWALFCQAAADDGSFPARKIHDLVTAWLETRHDT